MFLREAKAPIFRAGFLQRFQVPAAEKRLHLPVATIRPTECTGGPSLSGASAMHHIQPPSKVQHTYAEQGFAVHVWPFQSTDDRKGARRWRFICFTLCECTGNVGQRQAARTDPLQARPCRVKPLEPLRLSLSQAPPRQTRRRQIAMMVYVNSCQEDMMQIMIPSEPQN